MATAAVVGARGYLGRELMRLLLAHPNVDAVVASSTSQAGQRYADSVPAFRRAGELSFVADDDAAVADADVLFLATPGGEAKARAGSLPDGLTVIDLSRDHRLEALAGGSQWAYGMADLRPAAEGTKRIANPGCYPTASILALAPALAAGLVGAGPLIVDGKSGVSGAGVTPRSDLHFPEMDGSVRAYAVAHHDHTAEIRAAAAVVDGGTDRVVRFTPHLVPQSRGLLCTAYAPAAAGTTADDIADAYGKHYAEAPFVSFVPEADTGHCRGANNAEVAATLDVEAGLIVARGAIDNLVKGGAGTAVQNMNDALGWPTTAGLPSVGLTP